MTGDMIRRVASAILDSGEGCLSGHVYVDPHIAARAIIAAMREPTDGMLAAFNSHCDETGSCLVKTGYRAMIDAALA